MNVDDPAFLEAQIRRTMAFYHPRAIDPHGGFYHYLLDDGGILDRDHRHLLSSARYVVIYARHARHGGGDEYRHWARHGLAYLEKAHFRTVFQGYAWTLDSGIVENDTQYALGLAEVLLAYAEALGAGIGEARGGLEATHRLLQRRFWEPQWQRFADEADRHGRLAPCRGQAANLHAAEALLAAFEASGEVACLEQALIVARAIVATGRAHRDGWIWEHFDARWRPDRDAHREAPAHPLRPWGYRIGTQLRWAALLARLVRHRPVGWAIPAAERLCLSALAAGWDRTHGGLVAGLDPAGRLCDGDKLDEVQAAGISAVALLGARTGRAVYRRWHDRLWAYVWRHVIDHRHGGWYRLLTPDNRRYSDLKSPPGKVDHHAMGACRDAMAALARRRLSAP